MNEEQCAALGNKIIDQVIPIRHKAMAENPGCVVKITVSVDPAPVKPFRAPVVTRPVTADDTARAAGKR